MHGKLKGNFVSCDLLIKLPPWYTCQLFLRYKRGVFFLGVLGFLKTTRSFPNIPEEFRSLPKQRPKSSEVCRRLPKATRSQCFSLQKSEIVRKVLSFIHFTHGFCSLHGSELTYFGNCVKQDGNNSHFSIRREKLARKREPAWDRSFQPAGVRLTPKAWELGGIKRDQFNRLHGQYQCWLPKLRVDR